LVQLWFMKKNGQRRYKYPVLGRDSSYFVKKNKHSDSTKKFSETDIINMLEFLIDNIFAMFGGRPFQHTIGIPIGTNCAPLLADLFLYSYEVDFVVNFPFICSNIPAAPAYGVYISLLIGYSRACGSYQDFLDRGLLLTRKLLNRWFLLVKLKSSLRKFDGLHHDLVDRYGISASQMTTDMFHCMTCRNHFPIISSFMTYHRVCN
jgi:hypothetical protein